MITPVLLVSKAVLAELAMRVSAGAVSCLLKQPQDTRSRIVPDNAGLFAVHHFSG